MEAVEHRIIAEDQYAYVCACGECISKFLATTGYMGPLAGFAMHIRGTHESNKKIVYEYILIQPEHGEVGIGPDEDLRAVEQDFVAWRNDTGTTGMIMRRPVSDWEEMPNDYAEPDV